MDPSLTLECVSIETQNQAQPSVQESDMLAQRPRRGLVRQTSVQGGTWLHRSTVGYEDEDVGGSYERCYAEEADDFDLK